MMKTREEIERARERADQKKDRSIIGIGGAILMVLTAIGIYIFVTAQPDKDGDTVIPPASPANAIMSDSIQCERLVEIARRDGIVKGSRVGNHIRVDEKRWTAMTDEGRSNLMQYLACATFAGRSLDALDEGETVLALSARTGKMIAKAGRDGMIPAATAKPAPAPAKTP